MGDFPAPRNCWYVVGTSQDFPERELQGRVVCNRPIVIWRTSDGDVLAYDDRCAHKRFPLSKGRLMDDGTLECAYHGMRYDVSGKAVVIPSHPTGPISPQAKLKPFPVMEQDGLVWLWPGDPNKSDMRKPPRTPEIADPDWHTVIGESMDTPANFMLLIENLLDITHFYPLHDGNIGDLANSRIPIELEEGDVDGNHYVMTIRRTKNYKQPPYLVDWFHYDTVDREHTHCMQSPAFTRVVMRNAPPGKLGGGLHKGSLERGYVLMHSHTPVDGRRHIWRWYMSTPVDHMSKGDPTVPTSERAGSMFPSVVAEDHWALEQQQAMFDYPDGDYQEVFLKPDKALRRARQIVLQMVQEEESAQQNGAKKVAAKSAKAPATKRAKASGGGSSKASAGKPAASKRPKKPAASRQAKKPAGKSASVPAAE